MLSLILTACLCQAGSQCPDPRLQEAAIGGNKIIGYVLLQKRPLKFAKVRLYSASNKTVWIGKTDKDGGFSTSQLQPGRYRVEVDGWGSTSVQLNPKLDQQFLPQKPFWHLMLIDNGCVSWGMDVD